jgi:hypothetical protein
MRAVVVGAHLADLDCPIIAGSSADPVKSSIHAGQR